MMHGVSKRHVRSGHADGNGEAQREPPKPYGKHHQGHKTKPKRRRGSKHEAIPLHHAVGPTPLEHAGYNAKSKPENAAYRPGDGHERK